MGEQRAAGGERPARQAWPWWLCGALALAVFCWMPGQVVALLQALTGLGLVAWLLLQAVRFPQEWRALLTSLAGRTTVYESPSGHKVTLFAADQLDRLAGLDDAVRQRLTASAVETNQEQSNA
ncbi:MAG: hypothetical protein IT204_20145 [Fimbriimonadaceae bacterium]|nr:hypothetical protein [Fimbriimonadaceae bacterium]